ncbi:MAG: biotin--[acetyl-CoA-carboxylase] ligase [Candidatus Thorarchaeota archaeon]
MFDSRAIVDGLETRYIKPRFHHFEKVDSTNETAKNKALSGADYGLFIVADEQVAGKGRMNRTWVSPPGGLYFSVYLQDPLNGTPSPILGMLVACATTEAIRQVTGVDSTIKWPNDLMIGERKVGGILCEAISRDGKVIGVVVGVGINLNTRVSGLSANFRYPPTSLIEETGKTISREELLRSILMSIDKRIGIVKDRRSYNDTLEEWKWLNRILGYPVVVHTRDETVEGTAVDVRDDGALVVETASGTRKPITIGDVTRVNL